MLHQERRDQGGGISGVDALALEFAPLVMMFSSFILAGFPLSFNSRPAIGVRYLLPALLAARLIPMVRVFAPFWAALAVVVAVFGAGLLHQEGRDQGGGIGGVDTLAQERAAVGVERLVFVVSLVRHPLGISSSAPGRMGSKAFGGISTAISVCRGCRPRWPFLPGGP